MDNKPKPQPQFTLTRQAVFELLLKGFGAGCQYMMSNGMMSETPDVNFVNATLHMLDEMSATGGNKPLDLRRLR